MSRRRLGVVVLLPDAVAAEIDGLRRALGDGSLRRIRPHLTLVPPVNVPDTRLPEALEALRSAAAASAPFALHLGPAATFHPATPVVYLAVGGDLDALTALRDRVFVPPLARPLTHPFVPHATLSEEMAPDRIAATLAALVDMSAEVTVDRVHLLAQGPDGVWSPVADAPFGPPAVVGRGGLALELTVSALVDPVAGRLLAGADIEAGGPRPAPWAVTARRDGAVVGVAHGGFVADRLEVDALVVAPGDRRTGVGRHVVAAIESLGRARGATAALAAFCSPEGDALLSGAGWEGAPAWAVSPALVGAVARGAPVRCRVL
ncbi:MAG TPA: GNAT family N-acetyltransferase [Acidimicrobiales bacterium]|nr:GNAT family N-acetyltransferase [Acidimicrobiales bacterium]